MKKKAKKTGKPRLTVARLAKEVEISRRQAYMDVSDLTAAFDSRITRLEGEANNRSYSIEDAMTQAVLPMVNNSAISLRGEIQVTKWNADQLLAKLSARLAAAESAIESLQVARASGAGRSLLRPLLRKLRLAR